MALYLLKLLLLLLPFSDDSEHFHCKYHGNRVCDTHSAQQVTACLKSNNLAVTIDGKFAGCVPATSNTLVRTQ